MSLFEIAKRLINIITKFIKWYVSQEGNSEDTNSSIKSQVPVNKHDDIYIKSLLHDNEIAHLKKELDNVNRDQDYTDDEIRRLRNQVDVISKRYEELLKLHYEHLVHEKDHKVISSNVHTPQNDLDVSKDTSDKKDD